MFQGQSIDDVPSAIIDDAAQLVKANSISGNKINDIDVVYTMWQNLKKTDGMEAGQVAFHKEKEVRFKKCRIGHTYINAVFITARSHMRPGTIVLFLTCVVLNQGTAITLWGC